MGAAYNFVHTNAPPSSCGCFSMNGGDGWVGWRFTNQLSLVGQVASQRASNINGTAADLTLTSFLAGPRFVLYNPRRIQPFAQVLFGAAHASGLLTPAASGASGSVNAFALTAGGGADFRMSEHLSIRAVDVEYFYTRFDNGVNQHQNNLRIGAGLVVRFGSR